MKINEFLIIHPVEMVAGEDQNQLSFVAKIAKILPDRVGCPLIPVAAFERLLGGKDGQEILAEIIKAIGVKNMAVEGFAAELSENKNLSQTGMNAIADGKVDEPKPSGNWNSWLAALFCQRVETGSLPAGHDD